MFARYCLSLPLPVLLCACAAGKPPPPHTPPPPVMAAPVVPAAPAQPQGQAAASPSPPLLPTCPRAAALDAAAVRTELLCLLQHYIRIDTTNPPGNERAAARFLQAVLQRDGIEAELLESAPGRANLIARLPGATSEGALVLMHHMDVVPADPAGWQVPPFEGVERDGQLWGRGSLDNKGAGVAQLMAVLLLKRLQIALPHDVILLAVADEEAGGGFGARWLMQHHRDRFEGVSGVLGEGGAILDLGGEHPLYSVELAQKAPLWLRVTAAGRAGHGSAPYPGAATHVLVRALSRLQAHSFPIRVLPEVQAVFSARARAMSAAERRRFEQLERSLKDPAFARRFLDNAHDAALVHDTLSITMLEGSDKENVIPSSASAVLDLRLLPGEDAAEVTAEVVRVMAEPSLQVETLLSWQAHASPRDTPLFAAIEQLAATRHPGAPVAANVIGGFTDCNAFRAAGITCYGFVPVRLRPGSFPLIHGKDERVDLADLSQAAVDLAALLQIPR